MMRRVLLMVGCVLAGSAMRGEAVESEEAAMARIRAEILTAIGPGLCRNLVHCRLLPLGQSPCGGPTEYLAYSSGLGNPAVLETKASEYAFLEEEVRNKRPQTSEKCMPLAPHQAVCIDNRCRAQAVSK